MPISLKKLLMVSPQANLGGGAERMMEDFLLGLSIDFKATQVKTVFLKDGPFVPRLRSLGFDVEIIGKTRLSRPWTCWSTFWKLKACAESFRPDVIFSWMAYGHLFGGLLGTAMNIPASWYQISFAKGWVDRIASKIPAASLICVSDYVLREQSRLVSFSRSGNALTRVWPCVNFDHIAAARTVDKAEHRRRLGLNESDFNLTLVGRLQAWKGIHTVIQAMPALLATQPGAHLYIVGGEHSEEKGYARYLEKLIFDLGLQNCVTLAGRQEEPWNWMCVADVVVHASDREPFGIVAIEGMACGKPLITGKDGGVVEAARDEIEALHVGFNDVDGMGRALSRLALNAGLRETLSSNGLKRAQEFTRQVYTQKIFECLSHAASLKLKDHSGKVNQIPSTLAN